MLDKSIFGSLSKNHKAVIYDCEIEVLVVLFDSCQAAFARALSITNQPRSSDKSEKAIERLFTNRLDLLKDHIIAEMRLRAPKTWHDAEILNECVAKWEIQCGDWPEAIKVLVDLVNKSNVLRAVAKASA